MEAIEFKTILHDGKVTIPSQYSSQWEGKPIRVIVLHESDNVSEARKKPHKKMFQAASLNTKDFDFNRDEAKVR